MLVLIVNMVTERLKDLDQGAMAENVVDIF